MYLTENTSQAASVRVVRPRRTRSARGRLQKLVGKARKGFFDSLGSPERETGSALAETEGFQLSRLRRDLAKGQIELLRQLRCQLRFRGVISFLFPAVSVIGEHSCGGILHIAALPGLVGHPEVCNHFRLAGVVALEELPVQQALFGKGLGEAVEFPAVFEFRIGV